MATPFFGRGRDYAIYVSRLLKVVETQIWAQNDRNSRVYISTYNNPKLPDLPFSRNLAKTKIPSDAESRNAKIYLFQPKFSV